MQLKRVTPESVGISSSVILDLLESIRKKGVEMHSFMLLRHGKVCAEGWWHPYSPNIPHIMFSFSKSLTSTAIGFAVQEGYLSVEDKLVDIFPEHLPEVISENLAKCTVAHLLMMGCGHEVEIPILEFRDSWISNFLAHPFVYEPGTHFLYNTAGTNMLCAILKEKTGQNLTEFLKPRLFDPLEMGEVPCFAYRGIEAGGFGTKLCTEAMARFTQFVANKGVWEGKQLLSAAWFDAATAKHIDNRAETPDKNSDWQQGYCYQFWRCKPEGVFRGDGAFGQFGIVMPDQDAVLVITSVGTGSGMQDTADAVWNSLIPAMQDAPLSENADTHAVLAHYLQNLSLSENIAFNSVEWQERLAARRFSPKNETTAFTNLIGGAGQFLPDSGTLTSLQFSFGEESFLEIAETERTYRLPLGMQGHFAVADMDGTPYAANTRWRAPNKLEAEIRNVTFGSGARFLFTFHEDAMTLSVDSTLPDHNALADEAISDIVFAVEPR